MPLPSPGHSSRTRLVSLSLDGLLCDSGPTLCLSLLLLSHPLKLPPRLPWGPAGFVKLASSRIQTVTPEQGAPPTACVPPAADAATCREPWWVQAGSPRPGAGARWPLASPSSSLCLVLTLSICAMGMRTVSRALPALISWEPVGLGLPGGPSTWGSHTVEGSAGHWGGGRDASPDLTELVPAQKVPSGWPRCGSGCKDNGSLCLRVGFRHPPALLRRPWLWLWGSHSPLQSAGCREQTGSLARRLCGCREEQASFRRPRCWAGAVAFELRSPGSWLSLRPGLSGTEGAIQTS